MAEIRRKLTQIATRIFTDREDSQKAFWRSVDELSSTPLTERKPKVLVFYGVGGVGKSSLQKELIKQVKYSTDRQIVLGKIDFVKIDTHSLSKFLLDLAYSLFDNYKIKFPHFELCYSIYFSKKNPDFKYNEKELPFLKEASLIGGILSTIDGFGVAGVITGIVEKAYSSYKKKYLNAELKTLLKDLEHATPDEIEEDMLTFFSYDLETSCETSNTLPIFFLDTYESIWQKKNWNNDIYPDQFVRKAIDLLPYSLFIISGREKLRWENFDKKWINILEQHLLGNLSPIDTRNFINHCGINDEKIITKILNSCKGHPFHLDICIDTYFEINSRRSVSPDDFATVNDEILERLLIHLTREEVEILKLLCVPRFYDEDICIYLISNFFGNTVFDYFEEVKRFSFIESKGNCYFFHDLMRENLLYSLPTKVFIRINILLYQYYSSKLSEIRNQNSHIYIESIVDECFYHVKNIINEQVVLEEWISGEILLQVLRILQLKGSTSFLIGFISELQALFSNKLSTSILSIKIDMLHLQGDYRRAVKEIDAVLKFDRIDQYNVLQLKIRRIHHKMFYSPVEELLNETKLLLGEIRESNYSNLYSECLFMIGGNLGVLNGKFLEAKEWLVQSIKLSKQLNDLPLLCRGLRKYSDIIRQFNHPNIALEICEYALKIAKNNGFSRYEIYLLCTRADILRELSRFEEAAEIIRSALRLARKQNIKGWIGHCLLVIAELEQRENNYENSGRLFLEAQTIYNKIGQEWGLIMATLGMEKIYSLINNEVRCGEIDRLKEKCYQLNYCYEYGLILDTIKSGFPNFYRYTFL